MIRCPFGDHLGASWMPFLKVSWRTWRPLGSMVARCSPVLLKKSKAIRRPLGDQSLSWLGVWVSRCWCVPSGLAAQILKSPSWGSNRVKVIRPLAGAPGLPPSTTDPPRAPGPARATFPGRASAAGPAPSNRAACAGRGDADAGAAAVPASTRQAATQLGTPSAATSRRPLSATMARDRRFMFSSFVCVPNPGRDVQTVRGPALAGGSGPPRVAGFRNAHQLVIWCG